MKKEDREKPRFVFLHHRHGKTKGAFHHAPCIHADAMQGTRAVVIQNAPKASMQDDRFDDCLKHHCGEILEVHETPYTDATWPGCADKTIGRCNLLAHEDDRNTLIERMKGDLHECWRDFYTNHPVDAEELGMRGHPQLFSNIKEHDEVSFSGDSFMTDLSMGADLPDGAFGGQNEADASIVPPLTVQQPIAIPPATVQRAPGLSPETSDATNKTEELFSKWKTEMEAACRARAAEDRAKVEAELAASKLKQLELQARVGAMEAKFANVGNDAGSPPSSMGAQTVSLLNQSPGRCPKRDKEIPMARNLSDQLEQESKKQNTNISPGKDEALAPGLKQSQLDSFRKNTNNSGHPAGSEGHQHHE